MNKLLLCFLFLSLISCRDRSSNHPGKSKMILIRSDGKIETLPDMATFSIDLNCKSMSVKSSKACLVEKSNDLNKTLLSFGIKQEDILTTSVRLDKSYRWTNNSNVFDGYLSTTSLHVTVRNLEKLDEIYTELLENRNLELGGLNYTHSNIDSLKNEAYLQAMKKAGVLADKLIKEIPASGKDVRRVSNVEISVAEPIEAKAMLREEDNNAGTYKSISISTGTVTVSATLFVEYAVK